MFDVHRVAGIYGILILFILAFSGVVGVYKVSLRQPSEIFKTSYPETQVWIDQYNGTVLGSRDPKNYPMRKTFLTIQWELHSGQAFGLSGRIVICLVGLIPLILYITGFIR